MKAANTVRALAPPPRLFWAAWAGFAIIVLLVDLLDVQSLLAAASANRAHRGLEPVLWEFSSGAADIALFPLIWRAACWAPFGDGRWARLVVVLAAGSVVFSAAHIAGFIAIREVAYALVDARYRYGGWGAAFYEYQRDAIAYIAAVGGIWGLTWLIGTWSEPAPAAAAPTAVTFDIRDGARTLRVPLSDIAAVSSAGNYVEFNLVDCRKPLMRTTLSAIERDFATRGFVRIHRSWLVNAARVEAIEPVGSGDFTVTLAGGLKAPLSRRFRDALEALRG